MGEVERLTEALKREQVMSERLFRALEHGALFPGWRALREDYTRSRTVRTLVPSSSLPEIPPEARWA